MDYERLLFQRRFGKPLARSGPPSGTALRNRSQAMGTVCRWQAARFYRTQEDTAIGRMRRGRPNGRPAANNRLHTNQVNVAWFCDLRPATGAPYKGRPRPTNLSGLLGHLPYKGRHNDERIAEGDKPRATNHEPRARYASLPQKE